MEKLILYNSKIKEAMYGISFIFMRHIICGNFINYINNTFNSKDKNKQP